MVLVTVFGRMMVEMALFKGVGLGSAGKPEAEAQRSLLISRGFENGISRLGGTRAYVVCFSIPDWEFPLASWVPGRCWVAVSPGL